MSSPSTVRAPGASGPHEASGQDGGGRVRTVLLLLVLFLVGLLAYTWSHLGTTLATRLPGLAPEATGPALTGDAEQITVNQTARVTGLAPGSPAQELHGTFTVPGDDAVRVGEVTATVVGTDREGCGPLDFVITGSPSRVDAEVPPGEDSGSWSGIAIRLDNRSVNQDACKGARISIAYRAN